MKRPNIIIFSRDIRTGKTTELSRWLGGKKAAGILTPDVHGLRMLQDMGTGALHPLQTMSEADAITIGRFHFSQQGFEHARQILKQAMHAQPNWIVVDEVGKLELEQQKGLEPTLSELIAHAKKLTDTRLLLVVRDSLLEKALLHYRLNDALIVNQLTDL